MALGLLEDAQVPAPRALAVSDAALLATFERGHVLGEVSASVDAGGFDRAWRHTGQAWRRVHEIVPSNDVLAMLLGALSAR